MKTERFMGRVVCGSLLAFGRAGLSFLHQPRIVQQRSATGVALGRESLRSQHPPVAGQYFISTRLKSTNLKFVDSQEGQDDYTTSPEDLARWEQMYQKGEAANQEGIPTSSSNDAATEAYLSNEISDNKPTEIRVVTFDLDNTLWKTGNTIGAANDVLAEHLNAQNITVSRRIEKIMGDLFQADRPKYCPQCDKNSGHHEDCCQAPVLLTQLRTDAIAHVLEMENGFTAEQAQATAAEIFETWAQARHDAILDHMAPQVIETLESIRRSIQSADGTSVLIGAITDGNSNPGRVEALRPYFDFVVNAESVGVAKPDKRVYLEAVRVIALKHPTFSGLLSENATMEELEDLVGPYWVHVGDDFLKDVVAAKNMKMRTIWAVELVKHKLLAASKSDNNSSMEMEEFLKKVSSESVVSLGIGADDYLATSLTSEFVDAVAEGFSDVGRILADWHSVTKQEAAAPSNGEVATSKNDPTLTKANRNMPPVAALVNKQSDAGIDLVAPRAFRIIRENCSTDVPAPLKNRSSQTMKEVMSVAQLDKSSGVFGFSPEDAAALQAGEKALVIGIGGTELQFAKEIFSAMTVEEVLSLTEENPVSLNFILKEAVAQGPSIDLF